MAYWAGLQRDARFETDSSRARRQGTSAAVRARAPWAAGHWPPAQDRPLFPAGGILCRFRWRRNGTMRPSNSRRQPSRVQPGWHAPQRRQVLCDRRVFCPGRAWDYFDVLRRLPATGLRWAMVACGEDELQAPRETRRRLWQHRRFRCVEDLFARSSGKRTRHRRRAAGGQGPAMKGALRRDLRMTPA